MATKHLLALLMCAALLRQLRPDFYLGALGKQVLRPFALRKCVPGCQPYPV